MPNGMVRNIDGKPLVPTVEACHFLTVAQKILLDKKVFPHKNLMVIQRINKLLPKPLKTQKAEPYTSHIHGVFP